MCYKIKNILCITAIMCLLLVAPSHVWALFSGTVEVRVSDGNDDVEQNGIDNSINFGSSDLELVNDDAQGDQIIGIRFPGISIPQGSTITNAYILFTTDEANRDSSPAQTDLIIEGEASDNAAVFQSVANNVTDRPRTSSVAWDDIANWDTVGEGHQTPDLSAIVQEIVDRGGWASGNAMAFIIRAGTAVSRRVAESRNGSSSDAPLLHIEYTSDKIQVYVSSGDDDAEQYENGNVGTTSTDLELVWGDGSDQVVGIRFQGIGVPPGAVITNAYLEFATDEPGQSSGSCSLTIRGEAGANASAFSNSYQNISNRPTTAQSVEWNNIEIWDTEHEKHQTPDLSAVVQGIIGTAGWASGNAMAFIISGSGTRCAESYEGASGHGQSTYAPCLYIEYSEDPVPYITLDNLTLGAVVYVGNNASQDQFTITNTGSADMAGYTISDNAAWLSTSSVGGTLAAGASETIDITFNTSALAVGTYEATISIIHANAPNSPVDITLSLTMLELPAGSTCGNVPVYTENLVSPAILVLLDVSSSMTSMMNISSGQDNPQSPDLSSIVQEIVNREDWVSGNAMAFIITGTGHRTACSYDGSSGSAPLLHVTYDGGTIIDPVRVSQGTDDAEESSGGSVGTTSSDLELVYDGSNQTIGIRFASVPIPKDATIDNAYLEFEIDESQTEATSLTIQGHDLAEPPTFSTSNNDISSRALTSASVAWNNVEEWGGVTQQSRIQIGKDAISELVKDRSISWGFGTWSGKSETGYTSGINYTKIHVGCKNHDDAHQADLQAAITNTVSHHGTPFMDSLIAAGEYFLGNKADDDGAGDTYTAVDCQPMFLIDVTDGLGYYGSSVATISTETDNLCNNNISPVAVGFGIDNATQINAMAAVANVRGNSSDSDSLYALHEEVGGVGQPFLANNRDELVDALSTITETIKANIFHGSSPAPTTSSDLGDTVLIAKFDASNWTGDMVAITKSVGSG